MGGVRGKEVEGCGAFVLIERGFGLGEEGLRRF
jgi:hypothetical protein